MKRKWFILLILTFVSLTILPLQSGLAAYWRTVVVKEDGGCGYSREIYDADRNYLGLFTCTGKCYYDVLNDGDLGKHYQNHYHTDKEKNKEFLDSRPEEIWDQPCQFRVTKAATTSAHGTTQCWLCGQSKPLCLLVTVPAVAPTCTETGLTEGKKCGVITCNKVFVAQMPIAKLPHTEEILPAIPATYENTGLTEGKKCSVCQTILTAQQEIPRKPLSGVEGWDFWYDQYGVVWMCDHHSVNYTPSSAEQHMVTYTHHCVNDLNADTRTMTTTDYEGCTTDTALQIVPSTCVSDGYTLYKCSKCLQEIKADYTSRNDNHDLADDAAVAPTCISEGHTAGQHCQREGCDYKTWDTLEKLSHTEVTSPAVPASCTKDGLTEGKHCSVCKTVLTSQKRIAAKSHHYSLWSPIGEHMHEASCLRNSCNHVGQMFCTLYEFQDGEKIFSVCPVCGEWNDGLFVAIADAHCEVQEKNAIPRGELIVRGLSTPCGIVPIDIDEIDAPVIPLYGLTVAYEYAGRVEDFKGLVKISVPLDIDTPFTLIRLNTVPGEDDVWTKTSYDMENNTLSFETDKAGLFLLVPVN